MGGGGQKGEVKIAPNGKSDLLKKETGIQKRGKTNPPRKSRQGPQKASKNGPAGSQNKD